MWHQLYGFFASSLLIFGLENPKEELALKPKTMMMTAVAPLSDITNFRRSQSNIFAGCQSSPLSRSSCESTVLSPEAMSPLTNVRSASVESVFTASTTHHITWTRHEPYNWKCIPDSDAQAAMIMAQRAEASVRRANLKRITTMSHIHAAAAAAPTVAVAPATFTRPVEHPVEMMAAQQIPAGLAVNPIRCLVQFKCHQAEYSSTLRVEKGQYVYVQADRGMDIGVVIRVNDGENKTFIERTGPCGSIVRHATQREVDYWASELKQDEATALEFCRRRAIANDLQMEVKHAEFQFDKKKLTFYYDAKARVDFVTLLKELYREFGCRIWMEKVRPMNE